MVSMNFLRLSVAAALAFLPNLSNAAPTIESVEKRACSTFKIQYHTSGTEFDGWYVAPYESSAFQLVNSTTLAANFHIDSSGYLRFGAFYIWGDTLETTFANWDYIRGGLLDSKATCTLADDNTLNCANSDHIYVYYYSYTLDGVTMAEPQFATQASSYSISAVC